MRSVEIRAMEARTLMESVLEVHGLDHLEWLISAREAEQTGRIEAVFAAHSAMGYGERRLMLPGDPDQDRAMMERHARTVARLLSRDRDIARHGGDPLDPPAWAHMAHPFGISMLKAIGIDPTLCMRYLRPARGVGLEGNESRLVTVNQAGWDVRALINGTHARIIRITCDDFGFQDIVTETRLTLYRRLPETALAALAGRTIGDAVGHPVLDPSYRILNAQAGRKDGTTDLTMETRHEFLECPPEGCDDGWQRTDLHRR